jgi:predicted PurR-regulated permease PerM
MDDGGAQSSQPASEAPSPGGAGWRQWVKSGALLLVAAVSLYLVLPTLLSVFGSWRSLSHLEWYFAIPVFAAEGASYACLWELDRIALGTSGWFAIGCAQLAGNAVGRFVPGAPTPFTVEMLRRAGVDTGEAAAAFTASTSLQLGTTAALPLLALPAIIGGAPVSHSLVAAETQALAGHTPDYLDQLRHATGFLGTLQQKYDLAQRLRETTAQLPAFALRRIPGVTASAGSIIFSVLTVTVLMVYFLVGLPRGQAAATALLAGQPRHADRNVRILEESLGRIGGYVSGNLLISIIAGTLAFAVLELLGVPFAAALGFWVAIADLIPSVGAMLGAVLCVVVALFSSGADAVAVAAYFVVYQRVENYFILPRIMTKAIDLSAPTVIVTLLIGASLAGLGAR